jgi:putative hydrolase of the HAD superfamily
MTNHAREWFEYERIKFKLDPYFEEVFTSYELGLAKPDPKIYKILLNKHNLKPEECIFVDNMQRNVEGAENLGMKGITFESFDQLKSELKELGVEI